MYTLYYLNKNLQHGVIKVPDLDAPVRIPEDLVFSNLRKGIEFIDEPHQCIQFTDMERLIMYSKFFDIELLKEDDFRKANTYLTSACEVDGFGILFESGEVPYYIFDEGNVLQFPVHDDLPNFNTDVFLSYDGLDYWKVPNHLDPTGYLWGDGSHNRLYFSYINGLRYSHIDLVNCAEDSLPKYVYFQRTGSSDRTRVFTMY